MEIQIPSGFYIQKANLNMAIQFVDLSIQNADFPEN